MSLKRRMDAIEAAQLRRQRRMIAVIAAEQGLTYQELVEDLDAFFAMPLAEQLAEVDRIHAESLAQGIPWDDVDEIKATLTEHYRP